jgi:glycosyltransferase involved in cell wall biosynthesis
MNAEGTNSETSHRLLSAMGRVRQPAMPRQGFGFVSKRPEELLLLCFYDPLGIATVPETIAFLQSKSRFSITVLNLFEHRQDPMSFLKIGPNLNIDRFAGIVIHNSVSYNVDNLRTLDVSLKRRFRDFPGAKVLLKQDENYRFRELVEYIREIGFDLIFTCLPDDEIEKVYPHDLVGTTRFVRMLTGYITPTLRTMKPFGAKRKIDIGYRGSIQPLSFGRLAFEKRKIGDDVARLLAGRGLALDISSSWEDRLGGDNWFNFLLSCKATLGTESGASIFDLDGDLDARCRAAEAELGPFREDHEYAQRFLSELEDLEGNVRYNQISPRHFEAAATGTLQLLFPGEYSGILKAEHHYFSLRRDYSNLDEAIELILDERRRNEMTQAAFEEVVQNRAWWIETFVEEFDLRLMEALEAKDLQLKPLVGTRVKARNVLLIVANEPTLDPRLDWIAKAAPAGMQVHKLGILPPGSPCKEYQPSERGALTLAYPRAHYDEGLCRKWYSRVCSNPAGMAGIHELRFLERVVRLPADAFCETFGAPFGCERVSRFMRYLKYILDTTATLVAAAEGMRGLHAVIATDLDTLVAGLVIKAMHSVPLFYDAHEYWPEADLASFEFEKQFWMDMEGRLATHADYRQTVSPGLADLMSSEYGCKFAYVPNAELKDRAVPLPKKTRTHGDICRFLYQGGFAIGRGIDLLIKAWSQTNASCVLLLRGPDNAYKREMTTLASRTGLLGTRIFFPDPVPESELVSAAADCDVGLIPYTATGINHKFCCPNKLSQFMAAGLPILANRTSFVSAVIRAAGCGKVVDFSRQALLVSTINDLGANPNSRYAFERRGHSYFLNEFNWDVNSLNFYAEIESHMGQPTPEPLSIYRLQDDPYVMPFLLTRTSRIILTLFAECRSSLLLGMRWAWHRLPFELKLRINRILRRRV